jgi:hypothetical protein
VVTLFNTFNYVITVDDQIADHLSRHEQSHAILSYLSAFSIKELELTGTETTALRTAQWRRVDVASQLMEIATAEGDGLPARSVDSASFTVQCLSGTEVGGLPCRSVGDL